MSEILNKLNRNKNYPILKQENFLYSLLEIEKARLQLHLDHPEKARQHLELAKILISNRYGPLHPFILPVYELLEAYMKPWEMEEKKHYQQQIRCIKSLFPDIQWQGILDSQLLD